MIVKISNEPRDYAWGSKTLMPDALGITATGKPMAEVWFGTHHGSPARVEDGRTLGEFRGGPLGFLLKFLAAEKALSIQVHPSREQAVAGFAAEELAGIPVDAPGRTYRDVNPKNESIVAITPFELLAGIRPAAEVVEELVSLRPFAIENANLLEQLIAVAIGNPDKLFAEVLGASADYSPLVQELGAARGHELLARLIGEFGADRGVLLALFMRHIRLNPGQAVVVPPGTPHSYLSGLGVEIQDNSDNVMRAGLTEKHVDGAEFLKVLDLEVSKRCDLVSAKELVRGLYAYPEISDDYCLHRVEVSGSNLLADISVPGDSILVCVSGELAVGNSLEERVVLQRGEAAYLSSDAKFFTFAGSGTGYLGSEL